MHVRHAVGRADALVDPTRTPVVEPQRLVDGRPRVTPHAEQLDVLHDLQLVDDVTALGKLDHDPCPLSWFLLTRTRLVHWWSGVKP